MPTRNVVLTDRQAKLVDKLVAEGEYQNASEALRAGIQLLEQERAERKAKLKALRDAIQVGIDDIEAGRYETFTSRTQLRRRLREIAEEAVRHGKAARAKIAAE